MTRTSMYDRISERRIALEALAREEEERRAAESPAQAQNVVPLAMQDEAPTVFNLGGFSFGFPAALRFEDLQITAMLNGEPVAIGVQRRSVTHERTLDQAFDEAVQDLHERHGSLRVIRRRDSTLAGSDALALDFLFRVGHQERHGRLVGAMVPVADRNERQWLAITCVIDPEKPALKGWLLDFDNMLNGLKGL